MEKALTVNVLTPEGSLYEGAADAVFLPGSVSPFEVLPGHAPIISALEQGELRVVSGGETVLSRTLRSGVVRVIENTISVCAEL